MSKSWYEESSYWLAPDYEQTKIDTVLMSIQHDKKIMMKKNSKFLWKTILIPNCLGKYGFKNYDKILINPTGRFVMADQLGILD